MKMVLAPLKMRSGSCSHITAMLKTRYGDGLSLSMDIDKRYQSYLLPSLSLQLLVENAVKHNIVSKQQPLLLEIFTTAGNKLVVNNNLQKNNKKKSRLILV
jgi:LytS/YehU family sensor histidine kinase